MKSYTQLKELLVTTRAQFSNHQPVSIDSDAKEALLLEATEREKELHEMYELFMEVKLGFLKSIIHANSTIMHMNKVQLNDSLHLMDMSLKDRDDPVE